jgi:hypothetical protein
MSRKRCSPMSLCLGEHNRMDKFLLIKNFPHCDELGEKNSRHFFLTYSILLKHYKTLSLPSIKKEKKKQNTKKN